MSDQQIGQLPDQPAPPCGLLGWLFKLPAHLYKLQLGVLLGHRFMILVHEGRHTHRLHETPLEVIRYDGSTREAVVAAGWGRKTSWLHNVEAGLARQLWIGRERYVPDWRKLPVDEAVGVLDAYERNSGIRRSIVRAVLSRLLGWKYDGTPQARLRAVEQLPLLGFHPTSSLHADWEEQAPLSVAALRAEAGRDREIRTTKSSSMSFSGAVQSSLHSGLDRMCVGDSREPSVSTTLGSVGWCSSSRHSTSRNSPLCISTSSRPLISARKRSFAKGCSAATPD